MVGSLSPASTTVFKRRTITNCKWAIHIARHQITNGPIACREKYNDLDYSVADLESAVGGPIANSDDKATLLMGKMRNPSLSLHGIEGAFSGTGAKTVIPATVSGKFSLR